MLRQCAMRALLAGCGRKFAGSFAILIGQGTIGAGLCLWER